MLDSLWGSDFVANAVSVEGMAIPRGDGPPNRSLRWTSSEGLNVGTLPTFKMHNIGTVPTFEMHNVGTVPTFKMHNIGTVPTFKMHNIGTVPTYKTHNIGTPKFHDFF